MDSNLSQQLSAKINGRDIHIWGAHYLGLGLARALNRAGLEVRAFVDKNPVIQQSRPAGLPVLGPNYFLDGQNPRSAFVIIAATLYEDEIAQTLEQNGWGRDDFASVFDLRAFRYAVEVSGACNLQCPSCPRGNFPKQRQPSSVFMGLETFEKVLDKIINEDPLTWEVELFRWGEPLLNKNLPQMIEAARRRGLDTLISTNLNVDGIAEIVAAGPRMIMVSASGYGASYEQTHKGGRWPIFERNLRRLAGLRAELRPSMEVEVYYHIYKGRERDYELMRGLCDSLGLALRPTWACLLPLDHLHALTEGRPLPPEAAKVVAMQPLPATELAPLVKNQPLRPCGLKNLLGITPELAVPACSCWFSPEAGTISENFLETPISEIKRARLAAPLCRLCESERLHHYYLLWHEKSEAAFSR